MKDQPRCLMVCQAGEGVGLGHLMRSIAAANALQQWCNAHIYFLVQGLAVDRQLLGNFSSQYITPQQDLNEAIRQCVQLSGAYVAVFDLFGSWVPPALPQTLFALRKLKIRLVAIDALPGCLNLLDLLFIPSFFAPVLGEQPAKKVVYGWDCFLLNVQSPKGMLPKSENVLVLTGGSDTTFLGGVWPALLSANLPADTRVDWVTGPFAPDPLWPSPSRIQIQNHNAPHGLAHLMCQTSYALTVYGVSFYELLFFGVPTVVFSPYGDKDNQDLQAIKSEGLALVANSKAHAIELLGTLMSDNELSSTLSSRAKAKMVTSDGHRLSDEVSLLLTQK